MDHNSHNSGRVFKTSSSLPSEFRVRLLEAQIPEVFDEVHRVEERVNHLAAVLRSLHDSIGVLLDKFEDLLSTSNGRSPDNVQAKTTTQESEDDVA